MQEQGKGVKGKLDPLPQVKPYEPFAYNAFDLPDPFRPRKIEPLKGGSKLAPDLNRAQGAAGGFPLESLKMVGTLQRGKSRFALVRTTEKDIYQVKVGNYMGQNFGVVVGHRRCRNQAQGTGAGRRRRLDGAIEHDPARRGGPKTGSDANEPVPSDYIESTALARWGVAATLGGCPRACWRIGQALAQAGEQHRSADRVQGKLRAHGRQVHLEGRRLPIRRPDSRSTIRRASRSISRHRQRPRPHRARGR